jgi:hypothetical protein
LALSTSNLFGALTILQFAAGCLTISSPSAKHHFLPPFSVPTPSSHAPQLANTCPAHFWTCSVTRRVDSSGFSVVGVDHTHRIIILSPHRVVPSGLTQK